MEGYFGFVQAVRSIAFFTDKVRVGMRVFFRKAERAAQCVFYGIPVRVYSVKDTVLLKGFQGAVNGGFIYGVEQYL